MLKTHVWSPELRQKVWVEIAFPPGFTRLRPPFPALVLLDAQSHWTNHGSWGGCHTDTTAARLFRQGAIRPTVLIGVYSPRGRDRLYALPPGGGADRMADFLAGTLLSEIRARVPIAEDRRAVGVFGFSFGANMALYAGLRRPETFGLVASLSAYPHWMGPQIGDVMAERRSLPMDRLYIDCGTMIAPDLKHEDDSVGFNTWLMGIARSRMPRGRFLGLVHRGAYHTEFSWRKRIPRVLRFFYGSRR